MSIPAVIIAVLAVIGGIFALLRKRWRWSLAGSIAAALSLIILGIPAVVLIALSRDEFD
jgi:ascorbate-specific PTS system EIIC-type component UlaA